MLAIERNRKMMERARSYIHNYTLGEEAERTRYLRSDERLEALSAQLDGLRARRKLLTQRSLASPTTGLNSNLTNFVVSSRYSEFRTDLPAC